MRASASVTGVGAAVRRGDDLVRVRVQEALEARALRAGSQPRVVGEQLRRRVLGQLVELLRVDARFDASGAARSSARSAGPRGT